MAAAASPSCGWHHGQVGAGEAGGTRDTSEHARLEAAAPAALIQRAILGQMSSPARHLVGCTALLKAVCRPPNHRAYYTASESGQVVGTTQQAGALMLAATPCGFTCSALVLATKVFRRSTSPADAQLGGRRHVPGLLNAHRLSCSPAGRWRICWVESPQQVMEGTTFELARAHCESPAGIADDASLKRGFGQTHPAAAPRALPLPPPPPGGPAAPAGAAPRWSAVSGATGRAGLSRQ